MGQAAHRTVACRTTARGAAVISSVAMSLAQIEYFVAVSEAGHVGRAAQALRIAQPALSRQIRSLEDELGAQLFIRTPRGMTLSEDGGVFLQHARTILTQVGAAKQAVRGSRGISASTQSRPTAKRR